jgi:hypothetical protein
MEDLDLASSCNGDDLMEQHAAQIKKQKFVQDDDNDSGDFSFNDIAPGEAMPRHVQPPDHLPVHADLVFLKTLPDPAPKTENLSNLTRAGTGETCLWGNNGLVLFSKDAARRVVLISLHGLFERQSKAPNVVDLPQERVATLFVKKIKHRFLTLLSLLVTEKYTGKTIIKTIYRFVSKDMMVIGPCDATCASVTCPVTQQQITRPAQAKKIQCYNQTGKPRIQKFTVHVKAVPLFSALRLLCKWEINLKDVLLQHQSTSAADFAVLAENLAAAFLASFETLFLYLTT